MVEVPIIMVEVPTIMVEVPTIMVEITTIMVEVPTIMVEIPIIMVEITTIMVEVLLATVETQTQLKSPFLLIQSNAEKTLTTTELECASAQSVSSKKDQSVSRENPALPTPSEQQMETATANLDIKTTEVSVLNVLLELSGAQPLKNACSCVVKTQLTQLLLVPVNVLTVSVLWVDCVKNALLTISSAMDTV